MTGQTENKYFKETPNYKQVQQNKHELIVAAEAVLTQTLTLMANLAKWLSVRLRTKWL